MPHYLYAEQKPLIRWLVWEQVPNFILEGPYKGQGLGDRFTQMLQDRLPQYRHENLVSNTRRYQLLIKEKNVCVAWAWIVPGSENFRHHSRPVSLAPSTGIQVLKSKRHLFGEPGQILSLANLLSQADLKLGYLEGMSYSNAVHRLIEQYRDRGNIHFSSPYAVQFDLNMLDRNRVDYFFGFSAQAIFDATVRDIPNKYQFYNIDEMDKYTAMYSHCAKTPFGIEVVERINNVLTDEILMEHLQNVERWNGENANYREVFIDHVIRQNSNKLVTNPGH